MPTTTAQFDASKLKNSFCVIGGADSSSGAAGAQSAAGTQGDVGLWNGDFQMFADLGKLHYVDSNNNTVTLTAGSLAWAKPDELWVVSVDGNIYQWKKPDATAPATGSNGWTALSQLGLVRSVAFDSTGKLYAVDNNGQVNTWGAYSWIPSSCKSDWNVKMIAFQGDTVWCVAQGEGDKTEVGTWNNEYQRWSSLGEISAHGGDAPTIEMIAFDHSSTPNFWEVSSDGTIGYWESQDSDKTIVEQWIKPDNAKLSLPKIKWLAWQPAS